MDKKIDLIIEINKKIKIFVIHQIVDKQNQSEIKTNYNKNHIDNFLFEFDDKIFDKFNDIDLAISRSGASTIFELAELKIPFIAVPLPNSKDNHQYYNAKYFSDKNAWLINQSEFENNETKKFINNLLTNKEEILLKKQNMTKFSYQNTWNNVNQKLISLINEN